MRTVKSRRKRLQRGGEIKNMVMTIQDFRTNIITVGTGGPNDYFRNYYNIVYKTLDPIYDDMNYSYIVFVNNRTSKKMIDLTNNYLFIENLKKYNPNDVIEIKYDHTIEKPDGTKIDLKTNDEYKQLIESLLPKDIIDQLTQAKQENKKAMKEEKIKKTDTDTEYYRTNMESIRIGGKRKSKRKSRKRKRYRRKTRRH